MSFCKNFHCKDLTLFPLLSLLLLVGFLTPAMNQFLMFGIGLSAHYYICMIYTLDKGVSPFGTPILTAVFYLLYHKLLPGFPATNGPFVISYLLAAIPCYLLDKVLQAHLSHAFLAATIVLSTCAAFLYAF